MAETSLTKAKTVLGSDEIATDHFDSEDENRNRNDDQESPLPASDDTAIKKDTGKKHYSTRNKKHPPGAYLTLHQGDSSDNASPRNNDDKERTLAENERKITEIMTSSFLTISCAKTWHRTLNETILET